MKIAIVIHKQLIFSSHLMPLCDYLDRKKISYEKIGPTDMPSFDEGVVVSCVHGTLRRFPETYFTVLTAHNLTGLKGTKFHESEADLNLVPGMRNTVRMAEWGRSYVIAGYPKWDVIHPMRFKVDEVRGRLREEYGFAPNRTIVAFYPTQSFYHKPGLYQAEGFHKRCQQELGEAEFFVLLHNNFIRSPRIDYDLDFLRRWEAGHGSVHVLDGKEALPVITACHLFVTDTCSTVVTALSMKKPVLFIKMELERPDVQEAASYLRQIEVFQRYGVMVDEVGDLQDFIATGHSKDCTEELFRACVAYDDDRNCERIMEIITDHYRRFKENPDARKSRNRAGPLGAGRGPGRKGRGQHRRVKGQGPPDPAPEPPGRTDAF